MIGETVQEGSIREFPYIVSIKHINYYTSEPENDHVCTGVLVSSKDVLTMEHCFKNLRIQNTEVIVGSNNIREGLRYYVSWWMSYYEWTLIHSRGNRYSDNEMSMLRVSSNNFVQMLTLLTNPIVFSIIFFRQPIRMN
jgi:V8-like Glu-specific endopeptidase